MDLFSYAESYPSTAGWKGTSDTSRLAASSIPAPLLRAKVLRIYELRGPCTADEAAEALHMSVLSIRPRCSELRASGKIVDSGIRRPNNSGRSAVVWRLA